LIAANAAAAEKSGKEGEGDETQFAPSPRFVIWTKLGWLFYAKLTLLVI